MLKIMVLILAVALSVAEVPGGSPGPKDDFEETTRGVTRPKGNFLNSSYEHVYAIVIDGGSTGTRLHAFHFQKSHLSGRYTLLHDLYKEVNPGLHSYADDPRKGADTVSELLMQSNLQDVIPEIERKNTPLALKATAGLRLLPGEKAADLLNAVREKFADLPFLTNNRSVVIMDGVHEGIYAWITINFLSNRLEGSVDDMAAALDLGGGSTQVTFATLNDSHIWETSAEYLHPINVLHKNLSVYTHSYLGLGLMASRKAILQDGNPKGETHLKTHCMHPILSSEEWLYHGVTYNISGVKSESGPNNETCAAIVKRYIKETVKVKPEKLKELKTIYAFSFYFDRAVEYGLIDPFGGIVEVEMFREAAAASCVQPNVDQPFMCLDMTFIHLLLTEGFGLEATTPVHLYKEIDHHQTSWALGAAFHILQDGL